MADNLGGLFDSDPGFLEELASGTNEPAPSVAQQAPMPGVMSQNSGHIPQGNLTMMQPGHPHPGYNMAGIQQQQGPGYSSMQFQNQQPQTQFNQQNFNQFNQQQVYSQNIGSAPSQKQGHLNQNPIMSPTHRNQFGSPPSGMMHQGQVMYQYNAGQGGQRLPNPGPRQQMKVGQMQGWNQNQQMFNPQQQQQQTQQQQYLQQHEFPQPGSSMPQMRMQVPFSGSQSVQSQSVFIQRSGMNRMPGVNPSQPNTLNMSQQMYQHGGQNFNTMNVPQSNDPMRMQQPQTQQFMHQQQANQQFPQQQPQQQQFQYQQQLQQPTLNDNTAQQQQQQGMMRFSQTSPTQSNVQQRLPFNNMNNINSMPQQRANVPMLSPRPTPPPPSPSVTPGMLSPTGSTSSHQGGFNSLEPSPNHQQQQNSSSMFQASTDLNDTQNFSQFSQNVNQVPSQNTSQSCGPNMNVTVNTNSNNVSNLGQCSPVKKVVSPSGSVTSPSNASIDIQSLNQQIQQLYSMPQTPQTQQKILDLQEKVQMLKSQQMQQSPRPGQQQTFQQSAAQQQQQQVSQPLLSPKQSTVQTSQAVMSQSQVSSAVSSGAPGLMTQSGSQLPQQPVAQMLPQTVTQIPQSMPQVVQQIPQMVHIGQNGSQIVQPGLQGQQMVQQRPQVVQSGQMVRLVQAGPGNQNNQQKIFIIQQQQPGQRMPNPSQQQPQPHLSQPQTVLSTQVPALTSLPQPVMNGSTAPGQQLLIRPSQAGSGNTPLIIQSAMPGQSPTNNESSADNANVQQEKANKIIAEAIAKAQKSGNSAIPKVLQPPKLPATLADLDNPEQQTPDGEKPKKKRRYTPRKERGEKTPRSKKKKAEKMEAVPVVNEDTMSSIATEATYGGDSASEVKTDSDVKEEKEKRPKKKKEKGEKKSEKTPKSDRKKPKKPPATFLKPKKRKRRGSSDGSDIEIKITPPPSPENDEFKRRSGRNVKRKKYMDDVDLNLSDEDTIEAPTVETEGAVVKPVLFVENPAEEDAVIVDKILGSRMRKPDPDEETDMEEVEEFFVKYKNFSYLHCEWRTEAEIKDKRIQGKIRRFKMKQLHSNDVFSMDDELFNPDYVEVDRVLEESHTIDPNTQEEVTHYLVKWRSLPYEDSTWELQQDVDPEKVKQFKIYSKLPPEDERGYVERPKASEWTALKETHTYKNGNTLREYQLEGVNWLTFNWFKRQNCILADEMGLGKTIQSIAFLQEIFNYGIKGPFLVVAPLSTIANWQREFETWTDINAITYHGTSPSRYMLQEYEMYYRDEEGGKISDCFKFQALITTYEIILSDMELLRSIDWRCIVIDEAHRLKNKNCSLIKCLRFFDVDHKVLLSGTPLQNNVEELFSLLNFLEPSQFSSSDAFLAEFGNLQTEEQVDKLKAILKPMMLRRLKEDVEKNIARKEETIIEVELTNIQKKYYRAILEKNFSYLCKGANSTNVPSLLNTMMELRKCCNHPYLLNGAEENILSELRAKEKREPEHIQALIQASGKFVLLDKLLPRLKQDGHRVLIFSQMIRVLDIIEDYLIHKKYLYERLDGRIRGNLRQEAIDRYSKPDSDRFVFLICTKAGGLGINLTAADTVIIYDSDWNPQNDLQAQARCHRIGQNKMVKVYRLITRNSYEREMFNRASMKLGLDKAVLQSMGGEKLSPQQQLTKREIEDLLRKGAYGALMDDDSAGDKFCEEDIEQILRGRTQVIQIESEGKGSTFSKASFSVKSNRDDIDINDPEFWQKWAKKADVDTEMLDTRELIVDEPRVRKRTARYGNNDSLADMSDLGSDSDSDDDDSRKGKKSRRGRKGDDDEDFEKERHRGKPAGTGYGRSELFKVEKGLLHYGWGRWKDILSHARFKRPMDEKDVENVAKAILLYGLQYYKGDERIKEFISDLISQEKEGGLKNHSGLSAPVPRGRKGKKSRDQEVHFDANEEIEKAGIKMDRDIVYNKNAYKRHIHRHSNKVLLRVRTLFYLKHEVLGDAVDQIDQGKHVKDIALTAPIADTEPPAFWWDELADKSLLVGVYKHGYEKYNLMRQDPMLVFLERCGPPDNAALAAEMKDDDDNEGDDMDESSMMKDFDDEESLTCASDAASTPKRMTPAIGSKGDGQEEEDGKLPFPTASEMNTRLRRIITSYQRDFKKQQLKKEQQAKKMEKREKLDAVFREREARRRQTQMKWTRREEADFYRVVSTYGIEFDRHKGRYIWDKFRVMARLDKKTDEQLTEYFISFYHMCLRVCRKIKEEAYPPTPVYIEPITEERANRCIARIDLLSKIREEIIVHPKMEQRIKLCQKSLDLPSWWINGKHDRELLVGAAKHGLARTDYYIMNDEELTFLDAIKSFIKVHSTSPVEFKIFGKDLEDKDKDLKKEKLKTEEGEENSKEKTDSAKDKIVKDEQCDDSAKTEKNLRDDKDKSSPKKDADSAKIVKQESSDSDTDAGSGKQSEKPEQVKSEKYDSDEEDMDETKEEDIKKEKEELPKDAKEELPESMEEDEDVKKEVKEEAVVKEEKLVKKEVKEETDDKLDPDEEVRQTLEGEESQADLLSSVSQSLLAQWPKDRVVFHRLEQICYCVETGDWPFPSKMKNVHILGIDSNSNTPTRSLTPLTPKLEEDTKDGSTDRQSKRDKDFEVQMTEGEGLKMTFHKKAEKNKRSVDTLEAEKAARIQAILAQSIAASQASSDDSQQDSILSSTSQVSWPPPWLPSPPPFHMMAPPQGGADSPFLNGGHMSEEEMMMNRHLLEQGLLFPRQGRRGRKRKEEKMAEIAMAEALARRQTARALASIESDARVPVINLEDGSRLSGEDAPLKKNLESWLEKHPGHVVDSRVDDLEEGEIVSDFQERRKGRKPKFDPAFLEVDKLTGEENVSVINRLTGKKITGAKAPPLRYLAEWLEQNPMWDVDPKWSELVRAKGSLPKTLLPRIVTPSRRGRKPRDSPLSHPMLGTSDPHQAAALAASMEAMNAAQLMAAGFGKLPLPFGSIPGLGLSPMLGLHGFGFPSLSGSPVPERSESKHKDSKGSKEDGEKSKEEEKSSSPHPSFPLMYNPLMFNPALLAAQGMANFPLAGMDSSLINGHTPSKEEGSSGRSSSSVKSHHVSEYSDQSLAEDLSVRSKSKKVLENTTEAHSSGKSKVKLDINMDGEDMPCDLSMKPKSKEDKSKQKICSSDKLSRIVDTLKFRVNKMDEKPQKGDDKETKRHSIDAVLNLSDRNSVHSSRESEGGSSRKDSINSLSLKLATSASSKSSSSSSPSLKSPPKSSSSNHSKEPVPKIVQELLAAKEQREREEMMIAKQLKQEALAAKQQKLSKDSPVSKPKSSSSQGSEIGDRNSDNDKDKS